MDTRPGRLVSTQEGSQGSSSPGGTGKPRKGLKIYPALPHPYPLHPRPRARIQHGRQGQDNAPPDPKHVDTQIDMTFYMDTDTKSSHRNTALPQPFASSCTPPSGQDPLPRVSPTLKFPAKSPSGLGTTSLPQAQGAGPAKAARPLRRMRIPNNSMLNQGRLQGLEGTPWGVG